MTASVQFLLFLYTDNIKYSLGSKVITLWERPVQSANLAMQHSEPLGRFFLAYPFYNIVIIYHYLKVIGSLYFE